jgi:hypothetical protein
LETIVLHGVKIFHVLEHSKVELKMQLRLVLLCVNIVSYGTQTILAETARTRMEGAIRRLARWRAAGWKNLPLSGSPRSRIFRL